MKIAKYPRLFRLLMNLWPPFLGAGIMVKHISHDWRRVVVRLRKSRLNGNYMGTHFGGSLFAMTDPFYMIMLIQQLGPEYSVWDKTSAIEFINPVAHPVSATFTLNEERVMQIRERAADGEKHFESFFVEVVDIYGGLVARVQKNIYVKRKATKDKLE